MANVNMQELLDRWFRGTLTPEENMTLSKWILEQEDPQILEAMLSRNWEHFQADETLDAEKSARMLQEVLREGDREQSGKLPARLAFLSRHRWAAAAAAIVLLTGGYLLHKTASFKPGRPVTPKQFVSNDVKPPAKNLASIRLSNGQSVFLDSLDMGKDLNQGEAELTKSGQDEVRYSQMAGQGIVAYNTLYNPRGSRVASIILTDGTRVFLNAGSSLTYPVAFSGGERVVELTGEGFFEVARDQSRPFRVVEKDWHLAIHVLGTRFNVKAYTDENTARVTLVDGAVKVEDGKSARKLTPGQQASSGQEENGIQVVDQADIDAALAWKNGQFYFNKLEVPEIMREISRWYGIDVKYEGKTSERRFSGIIARDSNVSDVLKIFARAGIRYKIEGNTVIVLF